MHTHNEVVMIEVRSTEPARITLRCPRCTGTWPAWDVGDEGLGRVVRVAVAHACPPPRPARNLVEAPGMSALTDEEFADVTAHSDEGDLLALMEEDASRVAASAVFPGAAPPRTPAPCSLPLPGTIPADSSGPLTAGDDPAGS